MMDKRRRLVRTCTFWVWWLMTTTLALAATCGDPLVPPVIETEEEDPSDPDSTENQGSVFSPTPSGDPKVDPGS